MRQNCHTDVASRIVDAMRRALDALDRDQHAGALDYDHACSQVYYASALAESWYRRLLDCCHDHNERMNQAPIVPDPMDALMVHCLDETITTQQCPHRFINGQCELCGRATFPT